MPFTISCNHIHFGLLKVNQQIEFAMKLFTYVCIQMTNAECNVRKQGNAIKNFYSSITSQVEKCLCKTMKSPWICQLKTIASVITTNITCRKVVSIQATIYFRVAICWYWKKRYFPLALPFSLKVLSFYKKCNVNWNRYKHWVWIKLFLDFPFKAWPVIP